MISSFGIATRGIQKTIGDWLGIQYEYFISPPSAIDDLVSNTMQVLARLENSSTLSGLFAFFNSI